MSQGRNCPHSEAERPFRVCEHLWGNRHQDYCHRFTGNGSEYDIVCLHCRVAAVEGDSLEGELVAVCVDCLDGVASDGDWHGELGIVGEPTIVERPTNIKFVHDMIRMKSRLDDEIADFQTVDGVEKPLLVVVTKRGRVMTVDLDKPRWVEVARLDGSEVDLDEEIQVTVSAEGQFAAITNRLGQCGAVYDLQTGKMMMSLDRGNYQTEHTEFPVAFFSAGGDLRIVHATDWNRLDISDPVTGELMTERSFPEVAEGETAPHAVDYFHGKLTPSPGDLFLCNNGWVWAPAGIVTTFSLVDWLLTNVWESEDGESKRYLCQRHYLWDGPVAWLDERRIAVWGYGPDDACIIPAVLIFNGETGELSHWFPGPTGKLAFDGYLFSFSGDAGTMAFDVESGERLLHDPGFCPQRYHLGAHRFVSTRPDGEFFVLSRLIGDPT